MIFFFLNSDMKLFYFEKQEISVSNSLNFLKKISIVFIKMNKL